MEKRAERIFQMSDKKKINWTIVYTVIVTALIMAIIYLSYITFLKNDIETREKLTRNITSVEWLIYVNKHKLKKIERVESIEKEFIKREAEHYGLDSKKKCEDYDEKIKMEKALIAEDLERLTKEREKIKAKLEAHSWTGNNTSPSNSK